jgi:hypothetical protein
MSSSLILLFLVGCAAESENPSPREIAVASQKCYDAGGRALFLYDKKTHGYGLFCQLPD